MSLFTSEITLLLLEDDDIDAMAITRAFNKIDIGNTIIRAADGLEGLELLRSGAVPSPYIILLDLQMPRLSGLEFLEEIRQDPQLDKSIVFVLTTSKSDEDITASYKKNIAGYFAKENAGEEFLDIVKMLKHYRKIVHFPEA
ncbi:response regulator [Colwellia sp. M166]|jgi:CheY-like chemotaxis protein|uniref:response regulator n=1 Tax=Colwellia sp. M166 TaxID=2583805 RepID=UPI00211F1629|nr:response regulator [Colwellia sp. M166]UUO22085.1 response regulator [Colwellia sp. M166]|tara:strand:+ start:4616 stop:5041 length:426 start_codon:yes stop_codon:yes gene_type:complete